VAEQRVVLVLGGGGVKGLAHVGAWRAVLESGVVVSEVVGTSIGALVGACIAGGMGAEHLEVLARALKKTQIATLNRWALLFNGIRQQSVFRGDVFQAYLSTVLPADSFDALQLPLSVNAVDLASGEQVWFGAGGRSDASLADAVYASCALPVFYPPARIGERQYVDGGVATALGIEQAAARGADRIIAIDVAAGAAVQAADPAAGGMVAIHQRVMQIMGAAQRGAQLDSWSGPALVHVRPELEAHGTFDFGSTEYFIGEGYRATRAALAGEAGEAGRQAG
jgi:NTE family protein